MGFMKKLFSNTKKPEGFWGKMMAKGMNGGSHAVLAKWGLSHIKIEGNSYILDLGCGGGANVGRLLELAPQGKVAGLDYSEVSVKTSRETNRKAIEDGKCKILQGDVSKIPFPNESVNLVTAFETIYFWPELEQSFAEVYRVLKPAGRFLITNESDGKNEASLKWTKVIDGMRVYTGAELEDILKKVGFSQIEIDDQEDKDRICVVATK